ncbi:oxygenase MpaB family protein [Streptomyces fractus]|uniref:oxygenase MpaB family protein n=1 Tax=Streptomyces fractus TaxID=641806 RepID=UPI003CF42907
MPRKWISERIEQLDPHTDYDEIWRLTATHRPNDFLANLNFVLGILHVCTRERDAVPVLDGGQGKVLTDPHARADGSIWKPQLWWHYGSQHEKTRKSVEAVNRLHAHYARKYPDSFQPNDTYVATLGYEAAGVHRLQRKIGLPGYTDKQKVAAVTYARNVATHFRNATTGEPIADFPETFEDLEAFLDRYEAEDVPVNEISPQVARAFIQQFADRYFAKPLHPLARAWVVSLFDDHMIAAYRLRRPPKWAVNAYRALTKGIFLTGERVLADPTTTYTERRQASVRACPHAGTASRTG